MLGARPHSHDAITNSSTLATNRRTCPKRCVSQPVSGTEMALATANEVMTHVPCDGLTPRSPEIAGIDTLAIDESSTFMKVASDSAIVPSTSWLPCSGLEAGAARGGVGAGGVSTVAERVVMSSLPAGRGEPVRRGRRRQPRRHAAQVGRDDVVHQ